MHFITIFLASFLLCNLVTSLTIISSDRGFNDVDDDEFAFVDLNSNSISQTMYVSQDVVKSHRYYFTVGERQSDDLLLDHAFKQTGWKTPSNVQVNITYPPEPKKIKSLTFVMLTVYQESTENRISVLDGGVGKSSITIGIHANQTKYLTYKSDFYGFAK